MPEIKFSLDGGASLFTDFAKMTRIHHDFAATTRHLTTAPLRTATSRMTRILQLVVSSKSARRSCGCVSRCSRAHHTRLAKSFKSKLYGWVFASLLAASDEHLECCRLYEQQDFLRSGTAAAELQTCCKATGARLSLTGPSRAEESPSEGLSHLSRLACLRNRKLVINGMSAYVS